MYFCVVFAVHLMNQIAEFFSYGMNFSFNCYKYDHLPYKYFFLHLTKIVDCDAFYGHVGICLCALDVAYMALVQSSAFYVILF